MTASSAAPKKQQNRKPLEVVKPGIISAPDLPHTNFVLQCDQQGKNIYGPADDGGKPKALIKYQIIRSSLTRSKQTPP